MADLILNMFPFFSSGSPDADVLDYAYKKYRVLLTVDKDFGELAFRTKSVLVELFCID